MKDALIIGKWEFIEKLKRKSFLISIIITPLILIGLGIISGLFTQQEIIAPRPIGILNDSNISFRQISEVLSEFRLDDGQPQFILINLNSSDNKNRNRKNISDDLVIQGDLDGYIYLSGNINDSITINFRKMFSANQRYINVIGYALEKLVVKEKLLLLPEFDRKNTSDILPELNITETLLSRSGSGTEKDYLKAFYKSYLFILLLLMMILFTGGMFVRSVVEEKSNRIIEIILSSCSAGDLLAGKVIGLSLLGLFQLAVWTLIGFVFIGSNIITPEIFNHLWLQLIYFILGYVLYSAVFVGIGSVANTDHEAQQITGNVSIILIIPIIISAQVLLQPESLLSQILSYFPLTTAPAMLLRINIMDLPIYEVLLTILILIISIYLMILFSSKIFSIGILSYGKKPSIFKLLSWIRKK